MDYEIIISSIASGTHSIIAFMISRLFRKKYVLWSETWYEEYKFSDKPILYKYIRRKIGNYITRNSDAIVVAGSAPLKYHRKLGVANKKLFIANQSVEGFHEKLSKPKLIDELELKDKYIVLYLSRIIYRKGQIGRASS